MAVSMKIQNLSTEQMEELIKRYYAGERATDLISAFQLDLKPGLLVSSFPPERTEGVCRQCSGTLVRPRQARTKTWEPRAPEYCEICGHVESSAGSHQFCHCQSCREALVRAAKARQIDESNAIQKYFAKCARQPVAINSLSIKQLVYLAAIATACADESLSTLTNTINYHPGMPPIAPRSDDLKEIIVELWSVGALGLMPNLGSSAFKIEEDRDHGLMVTGVYLDHVDWEIRVSNLGTNEIMTPSVSPLPEEALSLWHEMSQSEALAYLEAECDRFNIQIDIGEKTAAIVRDIVEYFSTSESYFLIWSSVRDLLAAKEERRMARQHVVNSIPIFLKNKFDRYVSKGFDPRKWQRFGQQSHVSQILYNKVLCLGEKGFYERPSLSHFII